MRRPENGKARGRSLSLGLPVDPCVSAETRDVKFWGKPDKPKVCRECCCATAVISASSIRLYTQCRRQHPSGRRYATSRVQSHLGDADNKVRGLNRVHPIHKTGSVE